MTYPEHAERLWSVLVKLAQARETETYGEIGERLGLLAQSVSGALAPIHAYCERCKLPLLTALVVQKETGRPGPGYKSANDHGKECERVYGYDWSGVKRPTIAQLSMATRTP